MVAIKQVCLLQARRRQAVHTELSRQRKQRRARDEDESSSEEGGGDSGVESSSGDAPQTHLKKNHVLDRFR